MADINHEIKIHAAPQAVHYALTKPSELAKWHTSGTTGNNETFTTHPHDGPVFEWKVRQSDENIVEWECVQGPGNSPGTIAQFKLSPLNDGHTLMEFSHTGWSDTKGNFRKCNTLWAILLFHLQQYLSSQKTGPAFS